MRTGAGNLPAFKILAKSRASSTVKFPAIDELPLPISSFHEKVKETLSLEELIVHGRSIKTTYKITDQEAVNLEELTKLQSKCRLWEAHRAGRITASNFYSVLHTSCDKPSLSLVKRLCYPEAYKFSTSAVS